MMSMRLAADNLKSQQNKQLSSYQSPATKALPAKEEGVVFDGVSGNVSHFSDEICLLRWKTGEVQAVC